MATGEALLIAGNGSIGARVAAALAAQGRRVIVHHAGGKPIPSGPLISEIVATRTPLPITAFPSGLTKSPADVAIHFMAMGAPDANAFVQAFDGQVRRLVLISSCDVYRAYGRFIGSEPGPIEATPMAESAPLREKLYPYRRHAHDPEQKEYWYEKLEAERAFAEAEKSEFTVLRLPKVYGPGGNADLATVYGFSAHPEFRWTHAHVDNVAAAIALAAFHPAAAGEIFNIGEEHTPTVGERIRALPASTSTPQVGGAFNTRHQLHFSSRKIRDVLGFRDLLDEAAAMRAVAAHALA